MPAPAQDFVYIKTRFRPVKTFLPMSFDLQERSCQRFTKRRMTEISRAVFDHTTRMTKLNTWPSFSERLDALERGLRAETELFDIAPKTHGTPISYQIEVICPAMMNWIDLLLAWDRQIGVKRAVRQSDLASSPAFCDLQQIDWAAEIKALGDAIVAVRKERLAEVFQSNRRPPASKDKAVA